MGLRFKLSLKIFDSAVSVGRAWFLVWVASEPHGLFDVQIVDGAYGGC